jgi:hypothetical protein
LGFPAGKQDDQVDALGLVGQLLDRISGTQKTRKARTFGSSPSRLEIIR